MIPTVETDLMELDMYFVGTPWGKVFFFRLKRISEALLDNSFGLYLLIPLTLSSGFLHTRYYNYLQKAIRKTTTFQKRVTFY